MGRVSRVLKGAGVAPGKAVTLQPLMSKAYNEDLSRLTACWHRLPEHIRMAIMTLAEAAAPRPSSDPGLIAGLRNDAVPANPAPSQRPSNLPAFLASP